MGDDEDEEGSGSDSEGDAGAEDKDGERFFDAREPAEERPGGPQTMFSPPRRRVTRAMALTLAAKRCAGRGRLRRRWGCALWG